MAADLRMPAKAQPPRVATVYSWSGCYVGGGGGYGMWDQKSQFYDTGVPFELPNDNGGRGWFGTVQVGCDYQVGANIIIGAFADYDFSGIKGDMAVGALAAVGEEKLKSSWAAGGRIGWLPMPQLLTFVSGGYTEARFDAVNLLSVANGIPRNLAISKNTYSGWFLGTGYEYALGWLPGLFWKTEYRFADYGPDQVPIFSTLSGLPTGDSVESRKYVQTIRSELVWRFNLGGPVVARY